MKLAALEWGQPWPQSRLPLASGPCPGDLPIIVDASSQILGHFVMTAGCGPGQVMLADGEGRGQVLKGTLPQGDVAEDEAPSGC